MIGGMTGVVSIALLFLAVARITRLITHDRALRRPREWVIERSVSRDRGLGGAYFVQCPWCVSMYVGAAGAGAWWVWGDTRAFVAVCAALAASHATGWLASREG
jgi:hypothetical protein